MLQAVAATCDWHLWASRSDAGIVGVVVLAAWQERKVKELMCAHLATEISLKQLGGRHADYPSRISRAAFRKSTKTSPHHWLRERRIERAIALLAQKRCEPAADRR